MTSEQRMRPARLVECFTFDSGPLLKVPKGWLKRLIFLVMDQRYSATVLFRLMQYFHDNSRRYLSRLASRLNGILNGIEATVHATVGPGIVFHHRRVVIGGRTEIGREVHLFANVNFGVRNGGYPKVGDGVQIFANSVITGSVTIGNYAVVGPNSIVARDVPDFAVVAGFPLRVLKFRKKPEKPHVQYGEEGSGAE